MRTPRPVLRLLTVKSSRLTECNTSCAMQRLPGGILILRTQVFPVALVVVTQQLFGAASRDHEHLPSCFVQYPLDGCTIPKVDAMLLRCNLLLPCAAIRCIAGRLQCDWLHWAPHVAPFLYSDRL